MVPNVDLRKMQQFLAVSELNSFTKAAEKLHLAQPALSAAIKKLEDSIGVALIERKANSFDLTPAGMDFAKHCEVCLNYAARAVSSARSIASGNDGTLSLAFVSSAVHIVITKRLPVFLQNYPNIKINLIESKSRDIITMLQEARIDVGLLRGPIDLPSEIEFVDLGRDKFVLMVGNEHILCNCSHVTPDMLRTENFIAYQSNSPLGNSASLFCQDNGFTLRIAQEAIEIQTVAAMVGCGLGVALVPKTAVPSINAPVTFIALDNFSHQFNTGIFMVKRKDQNSVLLNEFFSIR